ncbi:MAG: NADP-dependent isocitrate dehydrogenase, partial [Pseudomonadota bacterium]
APIYDEAINFFKANGALDPATAGTVQNLGLMAQKAEEYGSHPTTFEAPAAGTMRIVLANGDVLHSHAVEGGDIWRSCTVKKAPIENWIQLALDRQRLTGSEAIFWLDENRAHDAQLIAYVKPALEAAGVSVAGKVVLVRYGECFRGLKVMNAERRGAVAVLIYSDPADDGYGQGAVYPDGAWRPESGVQQSP